MKKHYYFKRNIQTGRSCGPSPNIAHRLQAFISKGCTVPTPDSGHISSFRGSSKLLTHWAGPENKCPQRMATLLAQNLLWGPYFLVYL